MLVDFPGTAYNGAIREGRKCEKELLDIVRERRIELLSGKGDSDRQDFLSLILLASEKLGSNERVIETVVTNGMAGVLLASYDSTSAAVAMLLYFLAELPHIYDVVYKGENFIIIFFKFCLQYIEKKTNMTREGWIWVVLSFPVC